MSKIYFIQEGDSGNIKIGRARNPKQRKKQHQTSNSKILNTLLVINGDSAREKQIHKRFDRFNVPGTREWFYPTQEILSFIELHKRHSNNSDNYDVFVLPENKIAIQFDLFSSQDELNLEKMREYLPDKVLKITTEYLQRIDSICFLLDSFTNGLYSKIIRGWHFEEGEDFLDYYTNPLFNFRIRCEFEFGRSLRQLSNFHQQQIISARNLTELEYPGSNTGIFWYPITEEEDEMVQWALEDRFLFRYVFDEISLRDSYQKHKEWSKE